MNSYNKQQCMAYVVINMHAQGLQAVVLSVCASVCSHTSSYMSCLYVEKGTNIGFFVDLYRVAFIEKTSFISFGIIC